MWKALGMFPRRPCELSYYCLGYGSVQEPCSFFRLYPASHLPGRGPLVDSQGTRLRSHAPLSSGCTGGLKTGWQDGASWVSVLVIRLLSFRISYCTADKVHDKVFAYIAQSQHNENLECHAFLCTKRKMVSRGGQAWQALSFLSLGEG